MKTNNESTNESISKYLPRTIGRMVLENITKWYSNELNLQFLMNQLNKIMYTAKIMDQLNIIMTIGNIIEMV
jgi:hypothetical protein